MSQRKRQSSQNMWIVSLMHQCFFTVIIFIIIFFFIGQYIVSAWTGIGWRLVALYHQFFHAFGPCLTALHSTARHSTPQPQPRPQHSTAQHNFVGFARRRSLPPNPLPPLKDKPA